MVYFEGLTPKLPNPIKGPGHVNISQNRGDEINNHREFVPSSQP